MTAENKAITEATAQGFYFGAKAMKNARIDVPRHIVDKRSGETYCGLSDITLHRQPSEKPLCSKCVSLFRKEFAAPEADS